MIRSACCAFLASIAAMPAPAQDAPAELCDYRIENVTLQSTKAEVDAAMQSRGWFDNSMAPMKSRNRAMAETIRYSSTPPVAPPPGGYRPGQNLTLACDSLALYREDGVGLTLTLTRTVPLQRPPTAAKALTSTGKRMAREFCAKMSSKYAVRGCESIDRSGALIEVRAEPRDTAADTCMAAVSIRNEAGFTTVVERVFHVQLAPQTSRSRGR